MTHEPMHTHGPLRIPGASLRLPACCAARTQTAVAPARPAPTPLAPAGSHHGPCMHARTRACTPPLVRRMACMPKELTAMRMAIGNGS